MIGNVTLTVAQYDAIQRLRESFTPHERESLKLIRIQEHYGDEPRYARVGFYAGWGSLTFDIDAEGNSEQVKFGSSAISAA